MPDIFPYNKSIDKKIKVAVAKVLDTKVLTAHKIKSGEINHVYKISTSKGLFIARVFRYHDWPENGKLEWIEKQLSKLKVPHAKMVYYSKSKTFFPNGFMISEFIPGIDGTTAIKKKIITETKLYFELGSLASKIHRVRIKRYGLINNGKGEFNDYIKMQLLGIKKVLKQLINKKLLDSDPYPAIARNIRQTFKPLRNKIHPVLLHGDMSETNLIVTKKNKVILIDWDNARSGIWLADFIELSRRQLFDKSWSTNPARATRARNAFFQGYGKTKFTEQQIIDTEKTLQILRQVRQMHYYAFDKKDFKKLEIVKTVFNKLLRNQD
ncbi:MAG: aminoglycoside phosphotransferase family protein [Candidatus Doudnabacteria bacterium]|nr:aminoglycoside phosphotransferase family protein [Candidatus Doudnabacteria bacterium]